MCWVPDMRSGCDALPEGKIGPTIRSAGNSRQAATNYGENTSINVNQWQNKHTCSFNFSCFYKTCGKTAADLFLVMSKFALCNATCLGPILEAAQQGTSMFPLDMALYILSPFTGPHIVIVTGWILLDVQAPTSTSTIGSPDWRERIRQQLVRAFATIYPWLNAGYEGSLLVYQVLYLVNRTPYFSPWLHMLGLQVVRAPVGDQVS